MARVTFPIATGSQNWKAIREELLLDTTDNGVEKQLVAAATAALGPGQEVFVSRGYSKSGRLSVWIVDRTPGGDTARAKALREALARVRL